MAIGVHILTALASTAAAAIFGGAKAVASQTLVSGSLMRATESARVSPMMIVDRAVEHDEMLQPVLSASMNLFIAVYLQAIALRNVTVSGVHIIKRLEAVNPNRTTASTTDTVLSNVVSLESIENAENADSSVMSNVIPDEADVSQDRMPDAAYYASLESVDGKLEGDDKNKRYDPRAVVDKQTDVIRDAPALAIGKLIEVSIVDGRETYRVPVLVRLATLWASSAPLADAISSRFSSNETALERKYAWKSGRISSILELITCSDLVRNYRRNLMADADGIYTKLNPKKLANVAAAAASGKASIAQASNLMILSRDTVERVEGRLGGSFENQVFRERIFSATGIMVIAVIDQEEGLVKFYYDGVPYSNTVLAASLRSMAKKDGPDIGEVLKSLVEGNKPRL